MSDTAVLTFRDAYLRDTTRSYEGVALAAADVTTMVGLAQAVAAPAIVKARLVRKAVIAAPAAAVAGSSTAEAICIICNVTRPDATIAEVNLIVPAPRDTLVGADGSVDITDASVTGFTDLFLTGGNCRLADGSYINSLVRGYKL